MASCLQAAGQGNKLGDALFLSLAFRYEGESMPSTRHELQTLSVVLLLIVWRHSTIPQSSMWPYIEHIFGLILGSRRARDVELFHSRPASSHLHSK